MPKIEKLENGLTVITDVMPHLQSVAINCIMPGGLLFDMAGSNGLAHMLAELSLRGTQRYGTTQLVEAFDSYGIRYSASADMENLSYRMVVLSEYIEQAFELLSQVLTVPIFPEAEVDSVRGIFVQEIEGLKDNPAKLSTIELSKRVFPEPYNRSPLGERQDLESCNLTDIVSEHKNRVVADGAIISVAGNVKHEDVLKLIRNLLGDWSGIGLSLPKFSKLKIDGMHNLHFESQQQQLAFCFESAPFGDSDYYAAKVASQLLSGGMFGRLFTEVREKRGLVYTVHVNHHSDRDYGLFSGYAGTTTDRAAETLAVITEELAKLPHNITDDELNRAKANLKSSLVMSSESAGSRAATNNIDYRTGGRIRTIDEVLTAVAAVTPNDIARLWERFPSNKLAVVSLGKKQLSL